MFSARCYRNAEFVAELPVEAFNTTITLDNVVYTLTQVLDPVSGDQVAFYKADTAILTFPFNEFPG